MTSYSVIVIHPTSSNHAKLLDIYTWKI